jgi:general secretion pathway protein D
VSFHRTTAIGLLLAAGLAGCANSRPEDLLPRQNAVPTEPLRYSHSLTLPPPLTQAPSSPSLAQPLIIKHLPPAPAGGGAVHREPGTISLNFEKASLRSVVDAVLGDALGVPYTVDERVDGVVTLVSPQKLNREEALEVLDGVLRMNGATLIKGDDLYRVILAGNARQSLPAPKLGADQPGYAITVYVARHTNAAALQRLIEPLYQIPGALSADTDHNLLLITGSAEERRALSDAARLFDQDWLARQSVGIFPLHHAKPKALAEELRGMLAGVGNASAPGAVAAPPSTLRITAIDRLNAVMVVTLQPDQLDVAADWVTRLDQAGAGDKQFHVYAVRYAKTQTLAKTLSRLFGSGGGGEAESGNAALPPGAAGTRMGSANGAAAPAGAPLAAVPAGVNVGGPGQPQGQGQSGGFGSADHPLSDENAENDPSDNGPEPTGKGPRIVADPSSHSLMILANDSEYALIQEALSRLDAKPAQVLIEATIAEVTLNKQLQFGVQYYLRGAHLADNSQGSLGFTAANSAGPLAQVTPGFNGVIGSLSNPSVILSALNAVTDSRVLSSPQLLVNDSHEAVLKVGTQTPLLTQQLNSNLSGAASTVNSVEYHDTGVILRVLPRANDGDMVSLDIAQEVSQVVPTAVATLTPSITLRRIESSVTVQSGQTVMLGGLISESNSLTRNAIPGLGDIPLLGELFGNRDDARARTELVVFITPHVLRDEDQADQLTQELMGRLKELRLPEDSTR